VRKSRPLLLIASVVGLALVALAWWVVDAVLSGPPRAKGVTVDRLTRHGEACLLPFADGCAPTERKIAYYRQVLSTRNTWPGRELWVLDLDSRLDTKVCDVGRCYHATWSPDGKRLAFACREGEEKESTLRVWQADTGRTTDIPLGARRLLGSARGRPVWSPDGSRFALQMERPDRSRGLFICAADGSRVVEVAPHHFGNTITEHLVSPTVWSSDGSRVAFIGYDAAGQDRICTVDAAGGDLRVVTGPMAGVTALVPSGDGARVAFATGEGRPSAEQQDGWTDLWTMKADGGGARGLTHGTHQDPGRRLAWLPLGWANDDRHIIACWTRGERAEENGLALVDPDTGEAISVCQGRRGRNSSAYRLLESWPGETYFNAGIYRSWAASPDSARIATVGSNRAARLPWGLGSAGRETDTLYVHSLPDRGTVEVFASVHTEDGYYLAFGESPPSWTPDGEQIVMVMRRDSRTFATGPCESDPYLITLPESLIHEP
jgi:Tol biopolymer transport system component